MASSGSQSPSVFLPCSSTGRCTRGRWYKSIQDKGIQLGDTSTAEADSKKVIKLGKFCTFPCAVILQAGIPLRWLSSSGFYTPGRDSAE